MALTEDLTAFFADFGEPATPAAGAAITVIFDRQYLDELGVLEGNNPVALTTDADVAAAALAHGSVLTIRGIAYTVREIQPDGTGLTLLQLWAP